MSQRLEGAGGQPWVPPDGGPVESPTTTPSPAADLPATAATPPSGRWRAVPQGGVAAVVAVLLVAVLGVVAVGVYRMHARDELERAVAEVEAAFQQADCARVSRAVRRVQAFDDAESTVRVSVRAGDCADYAGLQAAARGPVRDHVMAFSSYAGPRRGPLVQAAEAQLARRLRGTTGPALADATTCGAPERVVDGLTMTGPGSDELAAGFLAACGDRARVRALASRTDRAAAITFYRRVLADYPLSTARSAAERAWAGELLAAGSGSVDAELGAPTVVRRDAALGDAARLLVQNGSPGGITVALTGRRPVVVEADDCPSCAVFAGRSAARCGRHPTPAVPVLVPAGTSTALLAEPDTGYVTARGRWRLEPGVVYAICIVSVITQDDSR